MVETSGFDPSIGALMSALLREIDGWSVREEAGRAVLELPLVRSAGRVELPLREPIGVGRIGVGLPRWCGPEGEQALDLDALLGRLLDEPAIAEVIGLVDPGARDRFVARVRASANNLARVLEVRADDIERLLHQPLGFVAAEQGLLLGHSVHPAPRLRERLGEDDERFVPELCGGTQLELWAVARERVEIGGEQALLDSLIASDPDWAALAGELDEGQRLVPLHPLQSRALLDDPSLARLRERGALRRLGPAGRVWAPTSSLRTLHCDAAPYMLKASLPVRLTNSLRTLAPAELERGVLLGRVLDETEAGALELRHRGFRILREPGYYGLADGPRASFVALRESPFCASTQVEALATLLQDHPRTGRSRLALRLELAAARGGRPARELAERWFAGFLRRAIEPIVEAQAEYGLLLSAHQQNLVLGLGEELEPHAVWFRDAQGTAYTDLALRRFGERLPGIAAARFGPPLGARVWAYSVFVNAVFNVIASLAQVPGVAQAELLERLRACLEDQRERGPADSSALEYLLDSPTLWTKANVRCFASGVDEVSLADPQTIYRALPNPLHRAPERVAALTGEHRVAGWAIAEARVGWGEPGSRWQRGRLVVETSGERARSLELELRDAGGRVELRWASPASADERALVVDHLFSTRPSLAHVVVDDEVHTRAGFYQQAERWHCRGGRTPVELGRARTGEIDHPRRPAAPGGLLYRRHCAAIDRTFSLRGFDRERDFDRFCRWMNDPIVAQFWEQAWPRERLSDYIEERLADPHVIPAIGSFDALPFAYFEIYWAKEDRLGPHYAADDFDRGFHMAVGEAEVRHRGWGRQWFLAMAHFSFLDDPRTQRLVGEPRVDQARVRGWANSTAWEEWGEIQFPHKRAALMVLTRERFFASFGGER